MDVVARFQAKFADDVARARAGVLDWLDEDPAGLRSKVRTFVSALAAAKGDLATAGALVATLPAGADRDRLSGRIDALNGLVTALVDRFAGEVQTVSEERPEAQFGALPALAVLVEAGVWIGLAVGGVVLAVAGYQYATGTKREAEALLVETKARADYAAANNTDPGAAVAQRPPAPPDDDGLAGGLMVGGLAMLGFGAALWWFATRKA